MCERTDVTTVRRSTPPPLELASALRGRCRLLTSGLYMGHAHFNRRERTSKAGTRFRPASEWIPIAVPALVSEDTFRTAQAQLAQNRDRQSGRPPARFYLLHGLLRCGHPKPRAPY